MACGATGRTRSRRARAAGFFGFLARFNFGRCSGGSLFGLELRVCLRGDCGRGLKLGLSLRDCRSRRALPRQQGVVLRHTSLVEGHRREHHRHNSGRCQHHRQGAQEVA